MALGCGNQQAEKDTLTPSTWELIQDLENKIKQPEHTADLALAHALVNNYVKFAEENPQHEKAAYCWFEAARLSMGIDRAAESVSFFDTFIRLNPKNERVPLAVFLQGFIFENYLNDQEQAKQKYEYYLSTFPTHEMASDAEMALKNLGKTPEELIREFEANQGTAEK